MVLISFVATSLLLGLVIVPDYGISLDERAEYERSSLSYKLYANELAEDPADAYREVGSTGAMYYGTAITVLGRIVEEVLLPGRDHGTLVAAHYTYFILFQAAVVGIYLLCRQFMPDWPSLFTAVFFGTQPLLWGHAFINPKDIPLMAMFILTVASGFRMVDEWQVRITEKRNGSDKVQRDKPLLSLTGILLGINLLLWSSPAITSLAQELVRAGYQAEGQGLLGRIFSSLTTFGSLEGYLILISLRMMQVYKWLGLLALISVVFLFIKSERAGNLERREWLTILLTAGIWGVAISTRTVAIFAGGIIGLYALIKFGRQAAPGLTIYTLTAFLVSYVTWPFLWVYSLPGLVRSLLFFGDHLLKGNILFEGQLYSEHDLPLHYLPKLISIQFTEPFAILAILGILAGIFLMARNQGDKRKLILVSLWFLLPVLYVIIFRPTLYNNFRQFLFIIPPLFIFVGLGFERISRALRHPASIVLLALVLLLPGLIGIVGMHPLQYSYYNQYVGGFVDAYKNYETDYWDVGWPMMDQIALEVIPTGSQVLTYRDLDYSNRYFEGRYDLTFVHSSQPIDFSEYDYAFLHYRDIPNRQSLLDHPLLAWFEVDGIPLYMIYAYEDSQSLDFESNPE